MGMSKLSRFNEQPEPDYSYLKSAPKGVFT